MTEAGLFTVTQDTREVAGLLVPYGVLSKPNMTGNKPLRFRRVTLPRDPAAVTLFLEHNRHDPIGRGVQLRDDEQAGVFAVFRINDTDEGDAWLADHAGTVALSPEVKDIEREPGDWATAKLTGAGSVARGAFEGAGLFSVAVEDDDPAGGRGIVPPYVEDAANAGAQHDPGPRPDDDAGEADDDEDDAADAAPDETPAAPDTGEEDNMADAVAPTGQFGRTRKEDSRPALSKAGLYAAMSLVRRTGDRSALQPYLEDAERVGLFALSDVKFDGAGGLVTVAGYPGEWLGQLWTGKTFQRRIVPLLTGKPLTALSMVGWVWGVKPAMAAWAGNKAPVPSNAPTVVPKSFGAVRFAGGHDLAREYYDFNVTDVIDSYGDAMVDSYAMLSDAYALTQLGAGATPYTPDPANTVNTGLLDIVDGALAVIAAGGTPSWAVVAPDIFKGILATPREDQLAYLDAAIGLEEGSTQQFRIVPDARLTAGSIIVGDKAGATAWELPGVPIRVDAPNVALGGIDSAFFGYIGVGVTTPAVVVKNTGVAGDSEGLLVEGVEESVAIAAEKSRK